MDQEEKAGLGEVLAFLGIAVFMGGAVYGFVNPELHVTESKVMVGLLLSGFVVFSTGVELFLRNHGHWGH